MTKNRMSDTPVVSDASVREGLARCLLVYNEAAKLPRRERGRYCEASLVVGLDAEVRVSALASAAHDVWVHQGALALPIVAAAYGLGTSELARHVAKNELLSYSRGDEAEPDRDDDVARVASRLETKYRLPAGALTQDPSLMASAAYHFVLLQESTKLCGAPNAVTAEAAE